jgi:hypothetical protein
LNDLQQDAPVSRFASVLAGAVLGLFSLGLGLAVVLLLVRLAEAKVRVQMSMLIFGPILSIMSYGLGLVAWRLIANKPTRYGSLFGPTTLRVVAAIGVLAAIFLVVMMVQDRTIEPIGAVFTALTISAGSLRYASKLQEATEDVAL